MFKKNFLPPSEIVIIDFPQNDATVGHANVTAFGALTKEQNKRAIIVLKLLIKDMESREVQNET